MTNLEVHHQIFRSHSGPDHEDNLITLCHKCHSAEHCHVNALHADRLPRITVYAVCRLLKGACDHWKGHREASRKSRGYCLEMICADFLAGASLDSGQPELLLQTISRLFTFLPGEQKQAFAELVIEHIQ